MATWIEQLADTVEALFAEMSAEAAAFTARSGLACAPGCGKCCLAPTVEARVVELLPMARALVRSGLEAEVLARLEATPAGAPCVMLAREAPASTNGRCTAYASRPSVCRLFGSGAVRTKAGPRPVTCAWQKEQLPEAVAAATRALEAGETAPFVSDYGTQLAALAPSTALGALLPINEALRSAILRVHLDEYARTAQDADPHPEPLTS